ncbi:MAG: YgiT-type zinc finger protein [Anaerolineales bacterium]|nr:YgiT-type zinc finger protein [Anaerolineales bacterium]
MMDPTQDNPPIESNSSQLACPDCRVGNLKLGHASFFTDVDGAVITLPDFPAWICDLCGYREYDNSALSKLQALLATEQKIPKPPSRVQPPSEPEPPSKGADTPRPV